VARRRSPMRWVFGYITGAATSLHPRITSSHA
jgi:hypothetical protein